MRTPDGPGDRVRLRVLGPVRGEVDGRGVDLGGPVRRAVLARLVVARGQVVPTDRLLADLWGEVPPATALAALQVHVSHLRRALEPGRPPRGRAEVLLSAAPGYALRLPASAVDAWRFEEAVTAPDAGAGRLAEALGWWTGPAYAEVADELWAATEAARLTELRLAAVERLAGARLDEGAAADVVADLDRHVREHPAREEAVRLLALALYRSGRQTDALAVLHRSRRHLAQEYGVDPGPLLRATEAAVLRHDPALLGPDRSGPVALTRPVPAAGPAVPAGPLGRDAETAALLTAADRCRSTATTAVTWVDGEAGEGKTTLLQAVARALSDPARGWRTTWGRCPEVDGAPPGWAWHEVLTDLDAAPGEPAPSPFQLARRTAAILAAAAPVVVVLDDVHRADDVTLQLLRQVVEQLDGCAVLVVCAYRGSEVGRGLGLVRAALASRTSTHLALRGLDRDSVAALAQASGRRLDGATLDWLADRTGGNPLFVRELARLLAAPDPAPGVPLAVADVLRARLSRLPGPTVELLGTAAVLGRDVPVDVLAAVVGGDDDGDLDDALDTAVVAGLLEDRGPGRLRFTHALVRDVLADDLPPARRRRLHGRVLDVLERLTPDDVDALAHHALAGLTPATAARAREHAVRAAGQGGALTSPQRAAELLAGALGAHDLVRTTDRHEHRRHRVALRCALVGALATAGEEERARTEQAVALAEAGDDRELVLAVLTAWDAPLVWTVRRTTEGDRDRLRAADRLLAGELPDTDRVRLEHARFLELETWDVPAALECSDRALTAARRSGDPRLLCLALNLRGYAALGPDLAAERRAVADELVAVADRHGLDDFLAVGHWLRFLTLAGEGDLAAATAQARVAARVAGAGQVGHLLTVLALWEAVVDLVEGRLDEGAARYEAVTAAMQRAGAATAAYMAAVGRFCAAWLRGDVADVLPAMRVADGSERSATAGPLVLCLLDAGREEEARRRWARREPVRRDMLWLPLTVLHAHAAARLGDVEAARGYRADLLPWAGRYAGTDCGTFPVGPVADALAACARLLGAPAPRPSAVQ